MQYSAREDEPVNEQLVEQLEALVRGLGMELIELAIFRTKAHKAKAKPLRDASRAEAAPVTAPAGTASTGTASTGTVQIRAIVYKPGALGTGDCAKVHRAIVPRLELEFPGCDFSVEVSTPGITRQVRDGVELAHYRGRGVRLWRTDISDWSAGLLEAADEQGITIKGKEGIIRLDYAVVAKAKLDPSQEEYIGH